MNHWLQSSETPKIQVPYKYLVYQGNLKSEVEGMKDKSLRDLGF